MLCWSTVLLLFGSDLSLLFAFEQAGQIPSAHSSHSSIKTEGGPASSGSTGSSVDSRGSRGPTGDLRDMISMYLPGDASNPQAQAQARMAAMTGHYPSHPTSAGVHPESGHHVGNSTVPLTHM